MSVAGWNPGRAYNDIPPLPPAHEVETRAVLKQCITARAALAELKQAALIPNQSMLINTLPLLEAGASSEIENIVTTTDALFRHVGNEAQANPATKEALRYSRALFEGFRGLKDAPLTTRIAKRQTASQYLKQLVAIGVLAEVEAGKEKLFIHPRLMQLLARDSNEFVPYGKAGG